MKLYLVCGGPSKERGISLNSTRSVLDHLENILDISIIYVTQDLKFYKIDNQIYSNTPEDFDFKIDSVAKAVNEDEFLKADIVFPLIHGIFGEDGQIQEILERLNIKYVGCSSKVSKLMFNKISMRKFLEDKGFDILEAVNNQYDALNFLKKHKKVIVKPALSGSSIGVSIAHNEEELITAIDYAKTFSEEFLVEEFCNGMEFTIIVLNGRAFIPSEIEKDGIFDYRKKYLPTLSSRRFCPPRFKHDITIKIIQQAEKVFSIFGARGCVRFDGWVMDEKIIFSDLNTVSGFEQNSFVFQQAARFGITHQELLLKILGYEPSQKQSLENKHKVRILFGGASAERQVSLMSGTNVWLKLLYSEKYEAIPYLLTPNMRIVRLHTYALLNHTVEEVIEDLSYTLQNKDFIKKVTNYEIEHSSDISLEEFLEDESFIFIALHGGFGENGELQEILDKRSIPYNGSGVLGSKICMDKYKTAEIVNKMGDENIIAAPKLLVENVSKEFYQEALKVLGQKMIIKPKDDGCSAGIVPISSFEELTTYFNFINEKEIPQNTFKDQDSIVELSQSKVFMLEPFISGKEWVELTVGVLESRGVYKALTPSLTPSKGKILTLEEKFQGGTGVNITPPPDVIINQKQIELIKDAIAKVSKALHIQNYARIDIFFNTQTSKTLIIEANTLPALTPSTVIYHQALIESMTPREFIEHIIKSSYEKDIHNSR